MPKIHKADPGLMAEVRKILRAQRDAAGTWTEVAERYYQSLVAANTLSSLLVDEERSISKRLASAIIHAGYPREVAPPPAPAVQVAAKPAAAIAGLASPAAIAALAIPAPEASRDPVSDLVLTTLRERRDVLYATLAATEKEIANVERAIKAVTDGTLTPGS